MDLQPWHRMQVSGQFHATAALPPWKYPPAPNGQAVRHYATSRKVAGSVPDEVAGFFNTPNPSSHTMALGVTQPLTEISTRNLPEGKERSADLTAIGELII
jgi:hypothetical protein